VRETCEIAIARMKWKSSANELIARSKFASVDPAPSLSADSDDPESLVQKYSVKTLRTQLCDESLPLFERYRSMFTLRDIGSDEAVLALCAGFSDSTSAIFRHEVAYVLGQIASPVSLAFLARMLVNQDEHAMVRHEAAEAMGAIASDEAKHLLENFVTDVNPIVKESCDVALDICDYWNSDEISTALLT